MSESKEFGINQVHKILADAQRAAQLNRMRNGSAIQFFPDGVHQCRWFFDPQEDLLTKRILHRKKGYLTSCPDLCSEQLEAKAYLPCQICELAAQHNDWMIKRKTVYFNYVYLYDTNRPGKHWQPGTTYLIAGHERMHNALGLMMAPLDEPFLMQMLDPHQHGQLTEVTVKKGDNGYVAIDLLSDMSVPPIELGAWYQPLERCMPQKFDAKAYKKVLAAVTGNPEGTA